MICFDAMAHVLRLLPHEHTGRTQDKRNSKFYSPINRNLLTLHANLASAHDGDKTKQLDK